MTTSRKIVFSAAGLFLLMIAAAKVFGPGPEPSYEGKTLSEWLEGASYNLLASLPDSTDNDVRFERAIRHFGTNSIPWLLRHVRYRAPKWSKSTNALCQRLQKIEFITEPIEAKAKRADGAAQAFGVLGSNAAGAIPALVRMLPEFRANDDAHPVGALAGIGEKALPALCAALTNRQLQCRGWIAWAFGNLGANARPALPLLLQCAQETNAAVAADTIFTLARLKIEPEVALPVIIPRLADPDSEVRWKTALALAQYGPAASNALPALRKALSDPEARVARMAQGAIKRINSNTLNQVPAPGKH